MVAGLVRKPRSGSAPSRQSGGSAPRVPYAPIVRTLSRTGSSSPELPVPTEASLDGSQRLARLATSGPRQGSVVKIFPKLLVLSEVNHNSGLLTLFVNHELNSLHVITSSSLQ